MTTFWARHIPKQPRRSPKRNVLGALKNVLRGCFFAKTPDTDLGGIGIGGQKVDLAVKTVSLLDSAGELCDLVIDRTALLHQVANLLIRVHHGGVIPSAEELTDLGQ